MSVIYWHRYSLTQDNPDSNPTTDSTKHLRCHLPRTTFNSFFPLPTRLSYRRSLFARQSAKLCKQYQNIIIIITILTIITIITITSDPKICKVPGKSEGRVPWRWRRHTMQWSPRAMRSTSLATQLWKMAITEKLQWAPLFFWGPRTISDLAATCLVDG